MMPPPKRSQIEGRRDQMFPTLEPAEIDRLRRFGAIRSYRAGEPLAQVGEVGHGMTVVLAGEVVVTRRDGLGRREAIVTHGPGAFLGELAQLSGRPALVDAYAEGPVEGLLDDKGFVRTGPDAGVGRRPLETSRPGVFAIGDVRSGSGKRVAAAVGEGAQVVAALCDSLAVAGRAPAVAKSRGESHAE